MTALIGSTERVLPLFVAAFVAVLAGPSSALAETVNWVTFPGWQDEDVTGSGSSPELAVDATFTLHSGVFDGRPLYRNSSAVVDDEAWKWPYENNVIPALSALGDSAIEYTLRFDYTNAGGLPANGTVVVIDLEDSGSEVILTGIAGGTSVLVNWQVSFVEVSGDLAAFPSWDPLTATLTGNTAVQTSTRNLVFFTTDRALEAVEFEVTNTTSDGIDFNTAAQTVDLTELILWVTFPAWQDTDLTGSGSSSDLSVDAAFTLHSGSFDGRPLYRDSGTVIADESWPYDNLEVPALSGVGDSAIEYTVRFDYTNAGGLPENGTVAVIDLEDPGSTVKLTGIAGGVPVVVNWQVSFLEVSGANAAFPIWDAPTNTLAGTGQVQGTTRNLVFFVTDRALDAIEFEVANTLADAIDFSTAAQSVVIGPAIPAFGPRGIVILSVLLALAARFVIANKGAWPTLATRFEVE